MFKKFIMKYIYKYRRLKLARLLERPDMANHFYMGAFVSNAKWDEKIDLHACDTTLCIAGFATLQVRPKITSKLINEKAETIGKNYLGLDDKQADDLFYFQQRERNPIVGARVLRHLAATNEVDWDKGYE